MMTDNPMMAVATKLAEQLDEVRAELAAERARHREAEAAWRKRIEVLEALCESAVSRLADETAVRGES